MSCPIVSSADLCLCLLTYPEEHAELDPVVIRDGSRGHYLMPLFVADAADLLGIELDPELSAICEQYQDDYYGLSEDDYEYLADEHRRFEGLLWDAGFAVWIDDGYKIFTIGETV